MDEKENLKKIMWLSNAPWAATGYGCQTRAFTPRIKELGYDIAITAFWGLAGSKLDAGGIKVYPNGYHPYGQDIIRANCVDFGSEYFISLVDAWVCEPKQFEGLKWMAWFPVDSEPLPPDVKITVEKAHRRIAMSKFGKRMLKDAGLDCDYIPHGIDTSVFKPTGSDVREMLGVSKDAYLIGMVAANKGNPSRKAFTPQIAAFAELRKKHDDAVLYIHAFSGGKNEQNTVNLEAYAESVGLEVGKDIIFAHPHSLMVNKYNDANMAQLYSAFDVHMTVSMGEGFGLPILEAQSCGCPVIVGDWTSMSELCFSGWKVPKSEADRWWTPQLSYQYMPRESGILDALEKAYEMRGNQDYRDRARKGALPYDADKVTEKYWKPFLEKALKDE